MCRRPSANSPHSVKANTESCSLVQKKKKKKEKKSTTSDSVLIRHKCRTGQGESLVIITINIVCCTVNSQERLHDPNDRAGMKTAEFIFSGAYAKKHETVEK